MFDLHSYKALFIFNIWLGFWIGIYAMGLGIELANGNTSIWSGFLLGFHWFMKGHFYQEMKIRLKEESSD